MNQNLDISKLLTNYEQVNEWIYLRKDSKAIAVIANKDSNTKIGFFTITPESKKEFKGTGLVLEGKVLEAISYNTQNPSYETEGVHRLFKVTIPNIATYLTIEENDNLTITKDHIKEFISKEKDHDRTNINTYLDHFSDIPCEEYAIDTPQNKLRNIIATIKLRYSPFMAKERKELIAMQINKNPDIEQKISSNLTFKATENIIEYKITNIIESYLDNLMINKRYTCTTTKKRDSKTKSLS